MLTSFLFIIVDIFFLHVRRVIDQLLLDELLGLRRGHFALVRAISDDDRIRVDIAADTAQGHRTARVRDDLADVAAMGEGAVGSAALHEADEPAYIRSRRLALAAAGDAAAVLAR